MVAQRQPVDRVIDLVVGLPVAAAVAAGRSIPLIRQASRQGVRQGVRIGVGMVSRRARQTLRSDPETSDVPVPDVPVPNVSAVPPPVVAEPAPAVEPKGADAPALPAALPLDDYDHLAARQVVDRLTTLTDAELSQIDRYERAHRHRQTVLGRIAQLKS